MKKNKEPLVVVTGNQGKANEIASITGWPVEIAELDIVEIQSLSVVEVAKEKATSAYKIIGKPVVVDDTSMSIEALNGLPGALISWFLDKLGPEGIVGLIDGNKNRQATVSTCIAYCDDKGVRAFEGIVEGTIPLEAQGEGGFGYDPIFIPKGYKKTYAEMSANEKNNISMRKIALEKFKNFLLKM